MPGSPLNPPRGKLEESSINKHFFYKKLRAFESSCLSVLTPSLFGGRIGDGAKRKPF